MDPPAFTTNPMLKITDPPNIPNADGALSEGTTSTHSPHCILDPANLSRQFRVSYSSVLSQPSCLVDPFISGNKDPFFYGTEAMVEFQAHHSFPRRFDAASSATSLLDEQKVRTFQELLRNASAGVLDCMQIDNGLYNIANINGKAHVAEDKNDSAVGSGSNSCGVNKEGSLELQYKEKEIEINEDASCVGWDCFGEISESEDEGDKTDIELEGKECNSIDNDMVQSDMECASVQTSEAAHAVNDKFGKDESADETESEDEEEIILDAELHQEIYIDKEQDGVPYRKRKRFSGKTKRPNERNPRMIGAVERALRSSSLRKTEHIFEPIIGMVFDSREEAREFYNLYSWEVGFGVKYNNSRGTKSGTRQKKDDVNIEEDYRSMQDIVCQKSGFDNRVKSRSKRCGCPAKIHLLRTKDYGWYISSMVKEHNHPLSETCGQKREWSSHRQIEDGIRRTIKYLRENNVPLTKIHRILGSMYGSNGDVPWTKRSLRTICNQIRKDQMDDDIKKTMEIFKKMREDDPGFQFSVELDNQARIKTLIWCSGRSRDQYSCFGDVITFDTTYCTNIYKMPFGLFVGVNNHFQTTIFAGVLMCREKTSNFKWVFEEFIKLMGGKVPQTILTDQCKAMTKAIAIVMPNTYHLWCKWHVMKGIREGLGPLYTKNRKFRDDLWLVVNGMLSIDEFERGWHDLIKNYGLENNAFMVKTYRKKEKWAKPWSKDKYCARMSSTQRSESANFMLKRFVARDSSMNHFVTQYNRLLFDQDREEDIAEDQTKQLTVIHERLWALERHALSIYTKAGFELFRKEVDKASNYVLSARDGDHFTISHDNPSKRAHWARVHYTVQMLDNASKFKCECGLYEHFGMLCCHSIRLMLKLDIAFIPEGHIMKRWTRDAKDVLPKHLKIYQKDQSVMHSFTFRNRKLRLEALELVKKGDMDLELFEIVSDHLRQAHKHVDEVIAAKKKALETGAEVQAHESSDEEAYEECRVGAQSEGEALIGNKYGASGSSAGMSDSEILKMRAPFVKRFAGRPRSKRFMATSSRFKRRKPNMKLKEGPKSIEYSVGLGTSLSLLSSCVEDDLTTNQIGDPEDFFSRADLEKLQAERLVAEQKKNSNMQKKKKQGTNKKVLKVRCGNCGLLGHKSADCYTAEV